MSLKTNIYLRELFESDITETYLSWFKDDKVTEFLDAKNLTRQNVIDYIKAGKSSKLYFMYAICDKDNDKHIGNVKIGPINYEHMISDLVTFVGDTNYWGKGIATRAIKLGNILAFERFNIRKLTGGINSDNVGSIKCYTKAGWIIEGALQNHYIVNGKYQDRVCVSCFNPKYSALGN